MSFDPFAAGSDLPPHTGVRPLAPSSEDVRKRVQVPAILLIVSGVLSLLMEIFPVWQAAAAIFGPTAEFEKNFNAEMAKQDPKTREQMEQWGWTPQRIQQGIAWGFGSWALVNPLASALVILGAVCMLRLKAYSLAVFVSALSALPFCACSGCCGLGQVAGFWALFVLLNPDVKAAFP